MVAIFETQEFGGLFKNRMVWVIRQIEIFMDFYD